MVIIGILKQAGNARTQTDIEEEKEIINLAVVGSMNKSKYGDINETYFTNELEKNDAEVEKSGNKFKVTFPSGRQYTVDQAGNIKEKNPNALEISELNENASTYFGWDVINYAETLPEELQDTEWQLFYAGALDGETEERIYLISKGYVKNTVLPEKNGVAPIPTEGSDYKARFSTYNSWVNSINDGVCNLSIYSGSEDIVERIKKYNKDYFITKNYSSTNPNMRAVAYMLDTTIWISFANSSEGYSEWAIGGPTIELLFTAYNKYKGKVGIDTYIAEAKSERGYQVSNNNGSSYVDWLSKAIDNDSYSIDNPYSVSSLSRLAHGYWLASPSNYNRENLMMVRCDGTASSDGDVSYNDYSVAYGFRPLILLDSSYTLEKTKDSNGKDAFKIVEQ